METDHFGGSKPTCRSFNTEGPNHLKKTPKRTGRMAKLCQTLSWMGRWFADRVDHWTDASASSCLRHGLPFCKMAKLCLLHCSFSAATKQLFAWDLSPKKCGSAKVDTPARLLWFEARQACVLSFSTAPAREHGSQD